MGPQHGDVLVVRRGGELRPAAEHPGHGDGADSIAQVDVAIVNEARLLVPAQHLDLIAAERRQRDVPGAPLADRGDCAISGRRLVLERA